MKFVKKILCIISAAALLTALPTVGASAASENTDFSGTRTVVFTADKSDVDNFISGGRTALDIFVRGNAPETVGCKLSADDRDLTLMLSFDFSSYDDYCAKTAELLTSVPSVLYNTEKGLFLLESHETAELLTFLSAPLAAQGCLSERQLADIFNLTVNELTVGNDTYTFKEKVSVQPEGFTARRFDFVNIETSCDSGGAYKRSISVRIDDCDEDTKKEVTKHFKSVGRVTEEEGSDCAVNLEFSAKSEKELVSKTMQALLVAVSLNETERYIDENTVEVIREEYFDTASLLNDRGRFEYTYKYPSYYGNLTAVSGNLTVNEDGLYASNQGFSSSDSDRITCRYERGFRFERVDISTDFSDIWGSITRKVRFISRTDYAAPCHDIIKAELTEKLTDGVTLNIYDKGGNRFYEFELKAWYMSDIDEFTKTVLSDDAYSEISDSLLPYGFSKGEEYIAVEGLSGNAPPPKEYTVTYKFASPYRLKMEDEALSVITLPDGSVQHTVSNHMDVGYRYNRINLLKILIFIVVLSVAAVVIGIVIKVIGKKVKSRPVKVKDTVGDVPSESVIPTETSATSASTDTSTSALPETEAESVPVPTVQPSAAEAPNESGKAEIAEVKAKFCPNCGAKLGDGDIFCEVCGTKTKDI